MGRYDPLVPMFVEWREIRKERKKPQAAESGSSRLFRHLSSCMSLSRKPQPYCDQYQSLLFTLPPEVRQAVWTHAVGNHDVKIVRKMTKLGHSVLPRDQQRLDRAVKVSTDPGWIKLPGYEKRYMDREVLAQESLLPLLQTSKRVYQEVLAIIYSQNRFEFVTLEAFYRFLQRSPTAGLQRVSQLKILWFGFSHWPRYETMQGDRALEHNESWADICNTIAEMGGLQELTIGVWRKTTRIDRMYEFPDFNDYDILVKIVAPLRGLSDRVNLQFIARESASRAQRYQDRLHSEGYTYIQLVASRGSRESSDETSVDTSDEDS